MFSFAFVKAAVERALGAFVAPVAGALAGTGLFDVDWAMVFSVAGSAAVASLLASLVKAPVGPEGPGLTEKVAVKAAPTGDA